MRSKLAKASLLAIQVIRDPALLPASLDGEKAELLPPPMPGQVLADFRDEASYFEIAFDLICCLYQLPRTHPAVADLRETLRGRGLR